MNALKFIKIGLAFFLLAGTALADRYVVQPGTPGGTDTGEFDDWAIAATQIYWAVAEADNGETVWVSNGTYALTGQVSISKSVIVRGLNGKAETVVNGNYPLVTNRCFYLANTGAVVDGITISNGRIDLASGYGGGGGGVMIQAGTLRNSSVISCVVSSTADASQNGGGGILLDSDLQFGMVSNCCIYDNISTNPNWSNDGSAGGGIFVYRGTKTNAFIDGCLVVSNFGGPGGGIGMANGKG